MSSKGQTMNGPESQQVDRDKDPDHQSQARDRGDRDIHVVIEDETKSRLTSSGRVAFVDSGSTTQSRTLHNSSLHEEYESFENNCVVVPENEIEAHRISNNYKVSIHFFLFFLKNKKSLMKLPVCCPLNKKLQNHCSFCCQTWHDDAC